jgi:SAM-dependent methyltransferase
LHRACFGINDYCPCYICGGTALISYRAIREDENTKSVDPKGIRMLAAELVGPEGSIVGINRSQEVLNVAKERAREIGLRQISFVQASIEAFSAREPFDLVIGRYILIHQSDPIAVLRNAARLVRPGGTLAFHEVRVGDDTGSFPRVPAMGSGWKPCSHRFPILDAELPRRRSARSKNWFC